MTRFASVLLLMMLLATALPVMAQPGGQPSATPAPTPAAPAGQAGGEPTSPQRGGTLEYVVAFSGAALVLLVVCYPSRRY